MKKFYFFIALISTFAVSAQSNITFSVDMTGQTFTTAYISGSFNGWAGTANPMTDMGGGIWSATISIADGEHEYKFTYDDWAGQENFTQGDVCTITNNGFTNRRLVVSGADQTLSTPNFSTCAEAADGNGPHNITFSVDMSGYAGSFTEVNINGENYNSQGLGAWCGGCVPMTDQGSGIWAVTLPLEEFAYQFKFTVDGWTDQEMFNPGDLETATGGGFTNRYISVDGPQSRSYVWNAVGSTLSTGELTKKGSFTGYPNPTNDIWNIITNNVSMNSIEVYDISGRQVLALEPKTTEVSIDGSALKSGIYFAKIRTDVGEDSIKLIKK